MGEITFYQDFLKDSDCKDILNKICKIDQAHPAESIVNNDCGLYFADYAPIRDYEYP